MNIAALRGWFKARGPFYVGRRWLHILKRYHLSPARAAARIESCVDALADEGCRPTFPVPGLIVERHHEYFRRLQDKGCELAVHGYQHKDLAAFSVAEAHKQLIRAVRAFERCGIEFHGFRCPYLGCTGEMLDTIPDGLFEYSSNSAVLRKTALLKGEEQGNLIANTLHSLYKADPSPESSALPWFRSSLLEIPICLPDDLMLIDGYAYDSQMIEEAWKRVLDETHQRGELFNLIFHPELADQCLAAFTGIIRWAKRKKPGVWIARLGEISDWWREKSGFRINIAPILSGLRLDFRCTPRATVLAKGFEPDASKSVWDGNYLRVMPRTLDVPSSPRPFIGVSAKGPAKAVQLLRDHGYILDEGETASSCGIYLDAARLSSFTSEMRLINFIESQSGPLVRFGRWPEGVKSAISVTGDLDALSLMDYFTRLYRY